MSPIWLTEGSGLGMQMNSPIATKVTITKDTEVASQGFTSALLSEPFMAAPAACRNPATTIRI